ncbi:MAG: TlpA disulfide reductase family protein [Deltaproteobacteria bacterium]|nr:TlpA disulfide reductase family protein [Deltaproteobacteria bacterium]
MRASRERALPRRARALALLALLLAGCLAEERPAGPAPPFTLPDLEGRELALADLAGRTVVVDFWATWCEPCKAQIPVLNRFQREHPEVAVLGVAVDADGLAVVEPFAREHAIGYRVLLGSESLAREYGVPGFPALVIVDAAGRLDSLHLGVVTPEALEEAVVAAADGP